MRNSEIDYKDLIINREGATYRKFCCCKTSILDASPWVYGIAPLSTRHYSTRC